MATVYAEHQVIADVQVHGTGPEQALQPALRAAHLPMNSATVITADACYHPESNLSALNAGGVNNDIADNQCRLRTPRLCC